MCLLYTGGGDGTLGFMVIWDVHHLKYYMIRNNFFYLFIEKQIFEYANNMIA